MTKNKNRYRFRGFCAGTKEVKKSRFSETKLTACFSDILNVSTQELFRDHTHVVLDKLTFAKVRGLEIGQAVEFTASVYKYTKLDKSSWVRVEQLGLENVDKLIVL